MDRHSRIQQSPFFDGKTFQNTTKARPVMNSSTWAMLRRQFFGGEQRIPPHPLPIVWPGSHVHHKPAETGLRITWLGHSSLLIEIDGITILSDPVWAERASPVGFIGPKRFHAPPIPLDMVPTPDLVLISHDHYDHLDKEVIRFLADKSMPFVTALGVGDLLERWGIAPERIHELEWWEELELAELNLQIRSAPSQHFSGRTLQRNASLWSSWIVTGPTKHIFVGCDSGFFPGFAEIGERYGPFDLVTLEIAQYDEAWPTVHMMPEQSVQAALDLRAKALLPVHWGTFCLSFHDWDEPIERVLKAAAVQDLAVLTPCLGQPIEPELSTELHAWWRTL